MHTLVCQSNQAFLTALSEVKAMVTVGAHSAARWIRTNVGAGLAWPDQGPYAGTIVWLSGILACQLALPWSECSDSTKDRQQVGRCCTMIRLTS